MALGEGLRSSSQSVCLRVMTGDPLRAAVIQCLDPEHGQTARQIAKQINASRKLPFVTKGEVNSVLYKLLASSEVAIHPTDKAPHWTLAEGPDEIQSARRRSENEAGKAEFCDTAVGKYSIADRKMRLITSLEMSPSDPHISLDYPTRDIVALVNINHPYWVALGLTSTIPTHTRAAIESEAWLLAFLEMRNDESAIQFMFRIRRVA